MSLTHVQLQDQVYTVDEAAGLGANLVVVQGTSKGEVKLPDAVNDAEIIGVTVHDSDDDGKILVRRSGTIEVELGVGVASATYINVALIADATGEVLPITDSTASLSVGDVSNCIGICNTAGTLVAGDRVQVVIAPHSRRREA